MNNTKGKDIIQDYGMYEQFRLKDLTKADVCTEIFNFFVFLINLPFIHKTS